MITYQVKTYVTTTIVANGLPIGKFIQNRLDTYKEPQREGTKKGDRIGFSKKKYLATLMMLLNTTQDCIAKTIGVSHGLLRKWNTEAEFKKIVEAHCREFAKTLNHTVSNDVQHYSKLLRQYIKDKQHIIEHYVP